jgi:nicotinate-nucleotide adenylyltransferase
MNGNDCLRVGIYGGTFAPIHNGHVLAAKAFMEQMKLDYLFVAPIYIDTEGESDRSLFRLRMCELAFEGIDGVIISDTAIRDGGKMSLVDILKELRRPDTRLFWLCGTDELLNFDKRNDYKEILSLCYPNYYRRESDPILTELVVAKITQIYKENGVMFRRIVTEPKTILPSQIRKKARAGEDISNLVAPAVARFIKENELYLEDI